MDKDDEGDDYDDYDDSVNTQGKQHYLFMNLFVSECIAIQLVKKSFVFICIWEIVKTFN